MSNDKVKNELETTMSNVRMVQLPNFVRQIKVGDLGWTAKGLSWKRAEAFLQSLELENTHSSMLFETVNEAEQADIQDLMLICKNYPSRFNYENLATEISSLIKNARLKGDNKFELQLIQLNIGMDLYVEPDPKAYEPVKEVEDIIKEGLTMGI